MSSKVLVLNSGSSSLKFKLFEEAADTLKAIVGELIDTFCDLLSMRPEGRHFMS